MRGRKFSEEEKVVIFEELLKNKKELYTEIANRLGVSAITIRRYAKKLGFKRRYNG